MKTPSFQSIRATAAKAGLDWFLLALIGMIGLAYLFPGPGIYEGPVSSWLRTFGTVLRAALLTVVYTGSIQSATNDVVTYAR